MYSTLWMCEGAVQPTAASAELAAEIRPAQTASRHADAFIFTLWFKADGDGASRTVLASDCGGARPASASGAQSATWFIENALLRNAAMGIQCELACNRCVEGKRRASFL